MGLLRSLPGVAPIEPIEACLFWLWIAAATSLIDRPSEATRAGSSQIRMLYLEPKTWTSPMPGTRFIVFLMLP